MRHIDLLTSVFDLDGCSAVDVGAGNGVFACQLHERGAHVIGVEIDIAKIDAVKAQLPDGVSMVAGRGEDLPFETGTQDLVCFIHSFHHVPVALHDRALAEARRVLKPGGRLHVAEPLPDGSMFDVIRFVEDETEVRTASHERMRRLADDGRHELMASRDYVLKREFADIGAFLDRIVFVDPARAEKLPAVKAEMERMFIDRCEQVDGICYLYQPCVAYHFSVAG